MNISWTPLGFWEYWGIYRAKRRSGGAPEVGTTHQGAPPHQARPGGLSPPGGPADPETDAIKSHISKKSGRKNYHDPRDEAI